MKKSLEQRDVLLQSKNLRKGLENCSDLPIVVILQQDFLDIYMTRKKENSYMLYIWNVFIFKCTIYCKCLLYFMLHVICKMVLQNSSLPKCDSLPLGVDAIKRYFNC